MVNSLYKRQIFTIFATMIGAFFLLTIGVQLVSQQFLMDELQHRGQKNAQFLGAYTSAYIQTNELNDDFYQAYVKTLALVSDSFIFVTATDEVHSYATDGLNFYPIKRNDTSRSVVSQITAQGEFEAVTDLDGIFTEPRYIYGITFTENVAGTAVARGIVVVSPNTDQIDSMWDSLGDVYLLLMVAVITAALLLLSYLSAKQVKPLNELSETARRFGQGELSARVLGYEDRTDEVGALTREFNAMANSLAKAEQQRSGFISNVSHELKTPMTTIIGFAEGLIDGTVPPEKREKALEIILSETRRLSRLVQQMLEISRLEVDESQPVAQEQFDLLELLTQVLISMDKKITSRNLDVALTMPEGSLLVWGNQDGITQVCYNLLDNAVKFATTNTLIRIKVAVDGKKVFVSVENQGEVLEEEDLPSLFQQFHKGDPSRHHHPEGLGLGLYLVKNILSKLQESITVTSVDGVTKFTFTLSLVV